MIGPRPATRSAGSAAGRPARRKARERALRRAEVLAAARRLFVRKGYARTTMVEIAAASEFAIGTLYQLFPSKEAIFRGLIEEQLDTLLAGAREAAAETGDARAQVEGIVRRRLTYLQENPDLLRLYLAAWRGFDLTMRYDFGARIEAKYRKYLDVLASACRRGIRGGVFRPGSERRFALALAGMIHALIARWVREKNVDLPAEGEAILSIFFQGILNRKDTDRRR
jgi:AcrR family transcriptional regulator